MEVTNLKSTAAVFVQHFLDKDCRPTMLEMRLQKNHNKMDENDVRKILCYRHIPSP